MTACRIRVLGEPRLVAGDHETLVAGRPGRLLVAMLLHEEGRTLDELAELVWAGDPPKTARAALHVHLGALRKLFAAVPPGLGVGRRGDRYVLDREGWELDAELAVRCAASADALVAVGDLDAAVSLLEQTLGAWTGRAFTVGGEEISFVATERLELIRLDLEERLVDTLLDTDQASRAEQHALRLVDDEPYREHRWAQLIRSLHLQARTADALRAFERARHRLEGDLGIGPGEELLRLERTVLTRGLATSEVPLWSDAVGAVPTALEDLIGRSSVVERVEATLARRMPVLLRGAPGAGKTRLAIEVARRAASTGRSVGWVDLRNAPFDARDVVAATTLWARRHAGGLVVLDNAEHSEVEVDQLLGTCGRQAPSVQLLVTSRLPLSDDLAVVTVEPLSTPESDDPEESERSESVQLLRSLLELLAPGVGIAPPVAADLCRQLGGLPLAIRLAADLARSVPVDDIAAASRSRLGPDIRGAVTALLDHLGPADASAFSAICLIAGQIDRQLAGSLVGGADPHTSISRLVDHGLVQFVPGHEAPYSVPEPLRDVGVDLLSGDDRRAALDRLGEACLERARPLALPTSTTPIGLRLEDQLRRELPWHRQSIDHFDQIGDDGRALELAAALDLPLYSLGWWRENVDLQERALAIPGGPSAARALVHAIRGRPGQFHLFDEAHNQTALSIATEIGDLAIQARAHYHLGITRWWGGRHDEALERFASTVALAREAGEPFLIGEGTRFIGMALVTAGHAERGLATQLELIELIERLPGMELLLPHLFMHLGHSRRHIGDLDAAVADLGRARSGFEALGNRASLIHVCAGLAEVYADLGRLDDALEAAGRSLDVSANGPIDVYDPWTLCTIARVHVAAGDDHLARTAAASAVEAMRRAFSGETHRVAVALAGIAGSLGEHRAVLRLAGLADVSPDLRELPFRSPLEHERLRRALAEARQAVGDEADAILATGARSNLTEAAGLIVRPHDRGPHGQEASSVPGTVVTPSPSPSTKSA